VCHLLPLPPLLLPTVASLACTPYLTAYELWFGAGCTTEGTFYYFFYTLHTHTWVAGGPEFNTYQLALNIAPLPLRISALLSCYFTLPARRILCLPSATTCHLAPPPPPAPALFHLGAVPPLAFLPAWVGHNITQAGAHPTTSQTFLTVTQAGCGTTILPSHTSPLLPFTYTSTPSYIPLHLLCAFMFFLFLLHGRRLGHSHLSPLLTATQTGCTCTADFGPHYHLPPHTLDMLVEGNITLPRHHLHSLTRGGLLAILLRLPVSLPLLDLSYPHHVLDHSQPPTAPPRPGRISPARLRRTYCRATHHLQPRPVGHFSARPHHAFDATRTSSRPGGRTFPQVLPPGSIISGPVV